MLNKSQCNLRFPMLKVSSLLNFLLLCHIGGQNSFSDSVLLFLDDLHTKSRLLRKLK